MEKLIFYFAIFITISFSRKTIDLNLNITGNDSLTIAFGSCFRIFDYKNDIFRTIHKNKPHLWAWMGDAAYTDDVRGALCNK